MHTQQRVSLSVVKLNTESASPREPVRANGILPLTYFVGARFLICLIAPKRNKMLLNSVPFFSGCCSQDFAQSYPVLYSAYSMRNMLPISLPFLRLYIGNKTPDVSAAHKRARAHLRKLKLKLKLLNVLYRTKCYYIVWNTLLNNKRGEINYIFCIVYTEIDKMFSLGIIFQ